MASLLNYISQSYKKYLYYTQNFLHIVTTKVQEIFIINKLKFTSRKENKIENNIKIHHPNTYIHK